MGVTALQEFIEKQCKSACVSVDLLKISRSYQPTRRGKHDGRFCLVVDAEGCLDRLYGGFFSDWVCGGQWNRMMSYLSNLSQACSNANMELIVYVNGALESAKFSEWYLYQSGQRKKVQSVFRHLSNKGTPPPKVWWVPPVFMHSALRMALCQLGVTVACAKDDYIQEIVGFCHEHNMQGVLAYDPQHIILNPPRYFSSFNMKLTYKGSLETVEYINDEVAKCLNLNPNRFCIFAALLGNHILSEDDLHDFYKDVVSKDQEPGANIRVNLENAMEAVVDYVRAAPSIDNLEELGEDIFKNSRRNKASLINKLKESVAYYTNGTYVGYMDQRAKARAARMAGGYPESGIAGLSAASNSAARQAGGDVSGYGDASRANNVDAITAGVQNVSLSDSSGGAGDSVQTPGATTAAAATPVETKPKQAKGGRGGSQANNLPPITPEIMKIATERHLRGSMSPIVYHVLSQGEVKFPVCLDDETSREFPSAIDLYRPIRQMIYSVLLNLNKLKIVHDAQNRENADATVKSFDFYVKEWVVRRGGSKPTFEKVLAQPVDWKAPSIERLWLGQQPDDDGRRMRAFLTIMWSESPLMLNPKYVPQHLILLCCVLRYLLQAGRILQRQELDAFLAMSVSPLITDVQTLQDLKLPSISMRGVQLGSIFMSGIETALFANDVCGAPIPAAMCCPWLFFDGKLFHFKLLKVNNNTPLMDICDGQVDQMMRVELMRQAIMENVKIEFAKPLISPPFYGYDMHQPYMMNYRPAGAPRMNQYHGGPKMGGGGRGILGHSVDARGGQLEVAGVVVGSWGPNMGGRPSHSDLSPHIMSVGPGRRGMPFPRGAFIRRPIRGRMGSLYNFGRNFRMDRSFIGRGAMFASRRKKRGSTIQTRQPAVKGRGTTVVSSADGSAIVSVRQLLSTQKTSQESNDAFVDAEESVDDTGDITVNGDAGIDELQDAQILQMNGEVDQSSA